MRIFPAMLVVVTLLFVTAAPFLLQGDPSSLRGTPVARGASPDSFTFEGHPVNFALSRVPTLDPAREVLLILAPDVGYTDAEVERIREFVFDGGRLLVAGDRGADKELLDRLAVGVYLSGVTLYSPVFQDDPEAMITRSTGRIAGLADEVVMFSPVAVEGGEAILRAPDPTWADTNGNGRPDLGERTVTAAVASVTKYGDGLVVAVGDGLLLHRSTPIVQRPIIEFLVEGDRVLVIDAAHRSAADPFGISSLLAGYASVAARTAILISAVGIGAFAVLRPRFTKSLRTRGRRLTPERHPPELLSAVLSELHPK